MRPNNPLVLAVAVAIVGLVDALVARLDAAPDELVPIASCGVERRALRRLARQGRLEVVRIGRKSFTTRRALAALVDAPQSAAPLPAADPVAAARAAYASKSLRVVRGGNGR
jgi:hypothetical protein